MATGEEKIHLAPNQIALLERMAVVIEKMGMPPAMAKVLALLTVSDDNELTFEQIKNTLNLSKGATSQAVNQLMLIKKIGYKTRIGERKRYFFSNVITWREEFLDAIDRVKELAQIHKEILAQRPENTEQFNTSIKELVSFMEYLTAEVPKIYKKFEDQ